MHHITFWELTFVEYADVLRACTNGPIHIYFFQWSCPHTPMGSCEKPSLGRWRLWGSERLTCSPTGSRRQLGVEPGPPDPSRGLHLQATPTQESMQCLYRAGPQEESHSSDPLIIIFDSGNTWYFLSASTEQHETCSKSKGNRTVIFISNIWYICSSRRKA